MLILTTLKTCKSTITIHCRFANLTNATLPIINFLGLGLKHSLLELKPDNLIDYIFLFRPTHDLSYVWIETKFFGLIGL